MKPLTRVAGLGAAFLLLLLFVLRSPGGPVAPVSSPPAPVDLNIVGLLDLSDRISPAKQPAQAARDVRTIRDLVDIFEGVVRQRLYMASRDRLRVAVAQQAAAGYDPAAFADKLTLDMRKLSDGGKPAFDKAKRDFLSGVEELYDAAKGTVRYTGANIPIFFRDHLSGYVDKPEPGRTNRTIVIILTDGYVSLDRRIKATLHDAGNRTTDMRLSQFRGLADWERVFDTGDHGLRVDQPEAFTGLEVLVLEIDLDPRHQDDKRLIFKYWLKWLGEMGFGKTELHMREDSSTLTRDKMEQFLRGQ